jgi:hypothetical protein
MNLGVLCRRHCDNKEGFESPTGSLIAVNKYIVSYTEMGISTISNNFVPRSLPILTDEETNSELLLLLVLGFKHLM